MKFRVSGRFGGVLAAALVGALAGPVALPASSLQPAARDLTIESSVDGTVGTALSGWAPSVSDDGRLVAFVGPAADGRQSTVYLRDREANSVYELTVPSGAARPGDSTSPVISGDSCTVTVITEIAYDVFRDDDRYDRWDVYRTTLPHCGGTWGEWDLVSSGQRGAIDGVDPRQRPAVSASGQTVAFVVPDDREAPTHGRVHVVDLTVALGEPGRMTEVPGLPGRTPTGPHTYVGQAEPALSADGAWLAFTTDALPAADGAPQWSVGPHPGGPARTEVAMWSRAEPDTVPVVVSAGPAGLGAAGQPSLSADGRVVAFRSTASDLVQAAFPSCSDTACTVGQVYVRQRGGFLEEDVVTLVSAQPSDEGLVAGTGTSSQPSLSADGTRVAFVTRAANLIAGTGQLRDDLNDGEVVVTDVSGGGIERVSTRPDGSAVSTAASSSPRLTANGRMVVFDSAVVSQMVDGAEQLVGRQVAMVSFDPVLSMPALDTGTVPVNWPSPEWYITLTNEGPGSFVPNEISVDDRAFELTGGTCTPLVPLAAGTTCTVNVVFTPVTEGAARATLTIAESGYGARTIATTIDGAGGEPTLSARPAGIDAGTVVVGESSEPVTVELTNTGFFTAVVSAVTLVGENAGDFAVTSNRCLGRSFGPTTSCSVDVVAKPGVVGSRSALLTFATASGQRTSVVLSAKGRYEPVLLVDASATAGQSIRVAGLGFPASSPVVVSLGDGLRTTSAVTGEQGEIDVRMVLARTTRAGQYSLTVSPAGDRFDPISVSVQVYPAPRGSAALSPAFRPGS